MLQHSLASSGRTMASTVLWRSGNILQTILKSSKNKVRCRKPWNGQQWVAVYMVRSQHFQTSTVQQTEEAKQPDKAAEVAAMETKEMPAILPSYEIRDHFIPMTRRSLVRQLMQEKNWLTEEELRRFESFAIALDSAIVNKHHMVLQDLKTLFDPINPDKDTVSTRQYNHRERLDNEFWLLQKLSGVMEKANFHELPKSIVHRALSEHSTREKVLVSVNPDNYDLLRIWVLGRDSPKASTRQAFTQRLMRIVQRQPPPKPTEYYKRVVLAVRPKKQDKLLLKAFKEVPTTALEKLLPDGKIEMSKLDRSIIITSISVAGLGVLGKLVSYLAGIHVDWTLLLTIVTGTVGIRWWTVYKNRRSEYLQELSRMLYFKNIANNRGLLALLVDRAEDELFKEALLVYSFLLTNRPPSAQLKGSTEQEPEELGLMTASLLERHIEEWIHSKTGSQIEFESSQALNLFRDFGILTEDLELNLHVLPLEAALRNLPQTPQTLTARIEESDIIEGYDQEPEEEKESDYKMYEKIYRKYFKWF